MAYFAVSLVNPSGCPILDGVSNIGTAPLKSGRLVTLCIHYTQLYNTNNNNNKNLKASILVLTESDALPNVSQYLLVSSFMRGAK